MQTHIGCTAVVLTLLGVGMVSAQPVSYQIEGDGIAQSLTGKPGDAARGKALIAQRDAANCLTCHSISDRQLVGGGTKGPSLDAIGASLTPAQIRLSVVELGRVKRGVEMPSFHKRGGEAPRLSAEQVEDVVAYLASLR